MSALFADHPDLLMDFTYFLPDAVQEQAKDRLRATVAEIEMKKRSYNQVTPLHGWKSSNSGAQGQKRKSDNRYEREPKSSKTSHTDGYGKKSRKKDSIQLEERKDEREKAYTIHPYHTISTERKFFDQVLYPPPTLPSSFLR